MPKENIDYSNTIIYKIYCKDYNIKDVYIGHTTNFSQRKYSHKISCNNKDNGFKIYNIIRQNGGWDNWDMIEIAKYKCNDSVEARIKENEHYKIENSTLNSVPPYTDKSIYYCNICKKQYNHKGEYNKHLTCQSHIKRGSDVINPNPIKKTPQFFCVPCCFETCNKKDFGRHLKTRKHLIVKNSLQDSDKPQQKPLTYDCKCGKNYKHRQGLSLHKKKCNINQEQVESPKTNSNESEIKILTNLVLDVVKQNQELTNKIVDICKTGLNSNQTNNISNSNINSNNKTFNLQFFLNETCKNAMNITDFVDSLQLQISDLENVGKLGYVEGISSIIVKNLNALDETSRPIHCTDKKRETFYIKDEDKWEKEDEEKNKIKKVIKNVACKNQRLLMKYKESHPGCNYSDSKYADQYSKLVIEAMRDDDTEKQDKIIRNIAKEVVIDKKDYL
jgi:hypothetical protein